MDSVHGATNVGGNDDITMAPEVAEVREDSALDVSAWPSSDEANFKFGPISTRVIFPIRPIVLRTMLLRPNSTWAKFSKNRTQPRPQKSAPPRL